MTGEIVKSTRGNNGPINEDSACAFLHNNGAAAQIANHHRVNHPVAYRHAVVNRHHAAQDGDSSDEEVAAAACASWCPCVLM